MGFGAERVKIGPGIPYAAALLMGFPLPGFSAISSTGSQRHAEGCAFAGLAFTDHGAAVHFGDALDDEKSKTHAGFLGYSLLKLIVPVKNTVLDGFRNREMVNCCVSEQV